VNGGEISHAEIPQLGIAHAVTSRNIVGFHVKFTLFISMECIDRFQ
jgi:hypothetical protein